MKSIPPEISNAAYALASKAYGNGHAESKDKLANLFPELAWDDLLEIYLAACQLHEGTFEIGSAVHDRKISEKKAKLLYDKNTQALVMKLATALTPMVCLKACGNSIFYDCLANFSIWLTKEGLKDLNPQT